MERRKSERVRCKLPCEIQRGPEKAAGTVLDMSEGGLSVETGFEACQGDSLHIRVMAPASTLEMEALVWHSRRVRRRSSAQTTWLLGLMICEAPDAYFDLVPRISAPPKPREANGAGAPDQAPPDEREDLLPFRIRVKQHSQPRTRILSLNADSEDEVRVLALADLEGDWEVLEIWAV